ncbi:hypothetical protein ES703_94883 [subsurface metagenome]
MVNYGTIGQGAIYAFPASAAANSKAVDSARILVLLFAMASGIDHVITAIIWVEGDRYVVGVAIGY